MKNLIKFGLHKTVDFIEIPKPAKRYLPKWYLDALPTVGGKLKIESNFSGSGNQPFKTMKMCSPFGDSLTMGYIFELWCDIEVIKKDENFELKWAHDEWPIFKGREEKASVGFETPENYYEKAISLYNPIYIKTPPGYSVMITQPLNRFDLPFLGLTGIVDTDKEPLFPGNYPMFLNKNCPDIIKKGTPLIQIIPFKRDEWISEENEELVKDGGKAHKRAMSVISRWYKDNAWSKKSYE